MAKRATAKGSRGAKKTGSKAVAARRSSSGGGGGRRSQDSMGDAFIKLLQSPLVAELVAVAATAALATLAEQGFTSRGSETSRSRRTGKAVKEAGKAAAAAVGRRLSTEMDEIKKAATKSKGAAKA